MWIYYPKEKSIGETKLWVIIITTLEIYKEYDNMISEE